MTVENLHDAIGQLPSDLIAKVDEKRCRKPKRIPFRRYAAIAACLVLVLGSSFLVVQMASGGAKETAAEAPAAVMQSPDTAMNGADFSAVQEEAPEAEAAPREESAVSGSGIRKEEPAEDAVCGYPTMETYAAGEIPPEGVAGEPSLPEQLSLTDIQYAVTKNVGTAATTSEPVIYVIRSAEELDALRQKLGYYTMDQFDPCAARYDGLWFESHDLLVVIVKQLYHDGHLTLDSVTDSGGSWCVKFYSGGPYSGEREDWFIFAGLDKDAISAEEELFAMFEVP